MILIRRAASSRTLSSTSVAMDNNAYQEGIEESIRRCEELLALTPLAFMPTETKSNSSASRSASDIREAKARVGIGSMLRLNVDIRGIPANDRMWKKNMELLGKNSVAEPSSEEKVDMHSEERKTSEGTSERSQTTSSQKTELEFQSSANPSTGQRCNSERKYGMPSDWKYSTEELTDGSLQPSSNRIQRSGLKQNDERKMKSRSDKGRGNRLDSKDGREVKETFTISYMRPGECGDGACPERKGNAQRVKDKEKEETVHSVGEMGRSSEVSPTSDLKLSDSEVSTQPRESRPASGQDDSVPEFLQTSVSEGSQVTLDSRWEGVLEISAATRSTDSEQRTASSCLEQKREMFPAERRSKSVPRQPHQEESLQRHQRSKSVARERIQYDLYGGSRAASYYKFFSNLACSAAGMNNGVPGKDRLKSLSRPRTEVYKKLAKLKALLEAEQLQECSFKPAVGRKPDPESAYSAPIFERITEIQQRLEYRKRARKVYEKEELDNCSFRPRINWRSQFLDKLTYQPIEKRFQELQRQKIEKLANAQLRKDLGLTFKPEINQKSIQLLKQKGLETIDVADRLTTLQPSFHQDCKREHEKKKSTFTPAINRNTEYIIASSKQFGGHSVGFLQRQQQYIQVVEEKKRLKEHEVPDDLTFQPNIGNSAIILKQSLGHDLFEETDLERFERLAYRDKERLWHAREKVAETYYSQFNFQPEIDEFSRILAGQTSLQDLYRNDKGQKVKEALEQAAREEFQQKCPFHPELNAYRNSNGNLRSIVFHRRQERKEKANSEQETRTFKELQELKECTFKPCVNPSVPREVARATIKGFERHLELQCIAKQMRKEQEELERKVFFSHAYTMPTRQYTIPRPFMLQTGRTSTRYRRRPSSTKGGGDSNFTMPSCRNSTQCIDFDGLTCQSRASRHSLS